MAAEFAQDLSLEDAEQLKAFLDKRLWFEQKLKVLEALPPVYPFVYPTLVINSKASASAHFTGSVGGFRLPVEAELKIWQKERDALEEDVFTFDGGDLGRMKEKTRAVTLVPLTAPSTHLVEITLALIVLIDRLLILLRRRADVLELVSLRLKWDALRLQVKQEAEQLETDIEAFVLTKARWQPLEVASPAGNSPVIESDNTLRSSSSLPSSSMPDSIYSPSRRRPRQSLEVPLLRSHITNLKIRTNILKTTALKRAGTMLDRIIDQAGPMKGLGGIDGPEEHPEPIGAVPDAMLDLQDELEANVEGLQEQVEWCRQLEKQWEQSDTHYRVSQSAEARSSSALAQLKAALEEPGSSKTHSELAATLSSIQADLSGTNQAILQPVHPAFPDQPDHNERLVLALRSSRHAATSAAEDLFQALAWHDAWVSVDENVRTQTGNVADRIALLHSTRVEMSTYDLAEISKYPQQPVDFTQIGASASRALQLCDDTMQDHQIYSALILRTRQMYRSMPASLKGLGLPREQQLVALEDLADEAADLTKVISQAASQLLEDVRIYNEISGILQASADNEAKALDMQEQIMASFPLVAFSASIATPALPDLPSRVSQFVFRDQEQILRPVEKVRNLQKSFERYEARLESTLAEIIQQSQDRRTKVENLLDLLLRIETQAMVANTILGEGSNWLVHLEGVQRDVKGFNPLEPDIHDQAESAINTRLDALAADIHAWSASLSDRILFVAGPRGGEGEQAEWSQNDTTKTRLPNPRLSAADPPLTPPGTPPMVQLLGVPATTMPETETHGFDLVVLDGKVRDAINLQTVRVLSALAASQRAVDLARQSRASIPGSARSDDASSSSADVFGSRIPRLSGTRRNPRPSLSGPNQPLRMPKSSRPPDIDTELVNHVRNDSDEAAVQTVSSDGRVVSEAKSSRHKIAEQKQSDPVESIGSASLGTPLRSSLNPKAHASTPSIRSTSTPTMIAPDSYRLPTQSSQSRNRNVSETPTRPRVESLRLNRTRHDSLRTFHAGPARHEIERASSAAAGSSAPAPSGTKRLSSASATAASRRTSTASGKTYVPNEKSQLDVAVGKVVNKLKMDVPIVPVGETEDEWKDQSGRYWIGAKGRAKLCFCRILRSQTVMVRVGGGWVELSKFLLDHFADAMWQASSIGSSLPVSITSGSLAQVMQDQDASTSQSLRTSSTLTPVRSVLRVQVDDPLSPATAAGSNGSPLLPLHFIRKASESPPVREREKEQLKAGRRSILGKDAVIREAA